MLDAILKIRSLRKIKKKLRAYFREEGREKREKLESHIPKIPIAEKHMKNCALLLNRQVMLSKLQPGGVVAEIGVKRGEFSELIRKVTDPHLLHLIDIWGNERYNSDLAQGVARKFEDLIENGRVRIHRKLSTDAAEDFQDRYFDWIYIDADHSFESMRSELIQYAPKMKTGGIIAGHDYTMGNWVMTLRYGVIEAVHEFCVEHDWELIFLTLDQTENQSFAIRKIQQSNESGD